MAGFTYQLLGSLDWATELWLRPPELLVARPNTATLVLEPAAGGDALHGALAVQFKATRRRGWTQTELVKEVMGDLMAAAEDQNVARFRLHTSARLNFSADFDALLRFLAPGGGGLALADAAGLLFTPPRPLKPMGASAYINWMLATTGAADPGAPARLLRVLGALDFVAGESEDDLIRKIDERLSLAVAHGDVATARHALIGVLLSEAKHGNRRLDLRALLSRVKIPMAGLAASTRVEHALATALAERLAQLNYAPAREARSTPPLSASARPCALCGPSGVGKTWQLTRAAAQAERDGALVLWVDAPSGRDSARREVAGRLGAAMGRNRLGPFGVRAAVNAVFGSVVSRRVCVFIDRFPTPRVAQSILSDGWWTEQGLEVVGAFPAADHDATVLPEGLVGLEVAGFSHRELRRYFKIRGIDWKSLPWDLREMLRRPILAKLYADQFATSGHFAADTEYALVEQGWSRAPDGFDGAWRRARSVLDARLDEIVGDLLAGRKPTYPWPAPRFGPSDLDLLERQGMLAWSGPGAVQLDHDRWLAWGLATRLADKAQRGEISAAALGVFLRQCWHDLPFQSALPGHALGYVPLDVLWNLASPDEEPSADAVALTLDLTGRNQLDWSDIATLGQRGYRLSLAAAEGLDENGLLYPKAIGEALAGSAGARPPRDLEARVLALLGDSSRSRRMIALAYVVRRPQARVLGRLVRMGAELDRPLGTDGFLENDAIYDAAEAVIERWPRAVAQVRQRGAGGYAARRTLAWMIVQSRPSLAAERADDLVDLLAGLNDYDRERLEPKCVVVAPRRTFLDPVVSRAAIDGFAFTALSAAAPDRALDVFDGADGEGLVDAVHRLGLLIRIRPDAEERLLRRLEAKEISPGQVSLTMANWQGVIGPGIWERLADNAPTATWRIVDRLAHAPSVALLDVLQARRGAPLERWARRIALGRSAGRSGRDVDRELEAVESTLLRIGGTGLAALAAQRLASDNEIEQRKGLDDCLVADSPAVVSALVALADATARTAPKGRVSLRPFHHLALIAPRRAVALGEVLAFLDRPEAVWAAGEIAVEVEDRPLCRTVLARLKARRSVRNDRLELSLLRILDDDHARERWIATRCLTKGDDWGRALAAWTARRLDDDAMLKRIAATLLDEKRTILSRRDNNTLSDLANHPRLGPAVRARLQALPKSVRRRLLDDEDLSAAWGGQEWYADVAIDAAFRFESSILNTPRDGQARLWSVDPELALEAFDEGLRRGGRASEGLARRAVRNAPEHAVRSIVEHFDRLSDQKTRDDVAKALRGAPDQTGIEAKVVGLITSETASVRLKGLELAGWLGGDTLKEAILQVLQSDPRSEIGRRADAALERMDRTGFLGALRARIADLPSGPERRRLIAIAIRADGDSLLIARGDPIVLGTLNLDTREWRILQRHYDRHLG